MQPLTVYNQDPATRGQVRNVLTTVPDLTQRYNGVEFADQHAPEPRPTIFGGFTIGSDYGDQDTGDLNNPNLRINNRGNIGFDSPYQIRGRLQLHAAGRACGSSGSLRSASGLPQTRTYVVTTAHRARPDAGDAECAGGRTRRLSAIRG